MISAEQLYRAHQDAAGVFLTSNERHTNSSFPDWYRLSWETKDHWQRTADEVNSKDLQEKF